MDETGKILAAIPNDLLTDLQSRYAEPQRAYHAWAHIEALLRHFEAHLDLIKDRVSVLWAICWHDAVYDPVSSENESRSAELFAEKSKGLLSQREIDAVSAMILATVRHELPEHPDADWRHDCGVFLDLDLSILAAPAPAFDAYEAMIRKEYSFVEEAYFRAGRRAVLSRFMERPFLYFTPELRALWENNARANLHRSIAALA